MASLLPPITRGFARTAAFPVHIGGCYYSSKGLMDKVSQFCVARIQTAFSLESVRVPSIVKEGEGIFDKTCDERFQELFVKETQRKMNKLREKDEL